MANKQNEKEKDKKNSIIIITILLSIGIIAFFGIGYQVISGGNKQGFVELKPINTTLNSINGEHKVSVQVNLGGKNKDLKNLNTNKVQNIVEETVSSLNYEKLVGKDGTNYLKQAIKENLNAKFEGKIDKVTIDSLLTDVSVSNQEEQKGISRQEYLDGLKWTKKK